jgi:hypothetical protein
MVDNKSDQFKINYFYKNVSAYIESFVVLSCFYQAKNYKQS